MTDRSTLEIFSLLPLAFHRDNERAHCDLARHLSALRKGISTLESRYNEANALAQPSSRLDPPGRSIHRRRARMAPSPPPEISRIFPYPTTFTPYGSTGNAKKSFTYCEEMKGRHLLFHGMVGTSRVCIKFVHRYGANVHAWCAERAFAPKLIACEALHGGWFMVIMELLDKSWITLADMDAIPEGLRERVHDKFVSLHQMGMVHGDLRDTNIMVKKRDGDLAWILIDFDWAGNEGEVEYPMLVNNSPSLGRPADAHDGLPILAEHDDFMFEHVFRAR